MGFGIAAQSIAEWDAVGEIGSRRIGGANLSLFADSGVRGKKFGERVKHEMWRRSASAMPVWLSHPRGWLVVIQVRTHFHMGDAMKSNFLQWLPMKPLEKAGVLVLDGGEEFLATDGICGGDGFVDQARPQGTEAMITGLQIPHGDSGTKITNAAEVLRDAQP